MYPLSLSLSLSSVCMYVCYSTSDLSQLSISLLQDSIDADSYMYYTCEHLFIHISVSNVT